MATTTPNIGLTLPVGTENVSRQVINGNWELIDAAFGARKEIKSGTVTIQIPQSTSTGSLSRITQTIGTNIRVLGVIVETATSSYYSALDNFEITSYVAYYTTFKESKLITNVKRVGGSGTINSMTLTVRYFYIEN